MQLHIFTPYPIEALDKKQPEFLVEDLILALQYRDSRIIVDAADSVIKEVMELVTTKYHYVVDIKSFKER